MNLSNFLFLESEFPILFNIGQSAEFNLHQDPVTCIFKLRQLRGSFTKNPNLRTNEIGELKNSFLNHTYKIANQILKANIDQLPQAILAKAFRGELVGQEVKEYVREIGEFGMVAEEEIKMK